MSSKFVPTVGMYFYMSVKTIVHVDRSYQGDIFYCMAVDDVSVVAERVFGGYGFGPQLFTKSAFLFDPIGPEVMKVIRPMLEHKHSTAPTNGVEE